MSAAWHQVYLKIKRGEIRVHCHSKQELRFWAAVNKNGPVHPALGTKCWVWMNGLSWDGYGWFTWNKKQGKAHRYSWELHRGKIPKRLCVCHRCDNPACVRPSHLFLGTHVQNMKDRESKGRGEPSVHRGEENGNSKLTKEDVLEIRRLFATGLYTYTALGKVYGVYYTAIKAIVVFDTWKWLQPSH